MKKLLITGSEGLIGSKLKEYFSDKFNVHCLDISLGHDLTDEKFVKEFTLKTVKGWKGLKLKYLEDLLLVDYPKKDADVELEYTEDNALTLVENSTEFDNWLNEVVFDLDNFRRGPEKPSPKPVRKAVSE